jgi:hypothetical protein
MRVSISYPCPSIWIRRRQEFWSINELFSGLCADEDEEECETIREKLENIDHVLDEQGIVFVATHELEVAKGMPVPTVLDQQFDT